MFIPCEGAWALKVPTLAPFQDVFAIAIVTVPILSPEGVPRWVTWSCGCPNNRPWRAMPQQQSHSSAQVAFFRTGQAAADDL
jgi:hypothetical protein